MGARARRASAQKHDREWEWIGFSGGSVVANRRESAASMAFRGPCSASLMGGRSACRPRQSWETVDSEYCRRIQKWVALSLASCKTLTNKTAVVWQPRLQGSSEIAHDGHPRELLNVLNGTRTPHCPDFFRVATVPHARRLPCALRIRRQCRQTLVSPQHTSTQPAVFQT